MLSDSWIKASWEERTLTFDASDMIATGDTIASVTVTIVNDAGTDVSSTMCPDAPTYDNSALEVYQMVKAGTSGTNYLATVRITTTNSEKVEDTLNIYVRDDSVEVFDAADTTLAEYKLLMRITNDDDDEILGVMIPAIKRYVIDYTGNTFKNERVSIYSDNLAFVASSGTITDAGSLFVTHYFTNDIDIVVEGSIKNDGIYHVTTAAAGTLTLASYESLTDEAAESPIVPADADIYVDENDTNYVTITSVEFPKALKVLMASLLKQQLRAMAYDESYKPISSEAIGDYSKTYHNQYQDSDFPKALLRMLDTYRKIRIG